MTQISSPQIRKAPSPIVFLIATRLSNLNLSAGWLKNQIVAPCRARLSRFGRSSGFHMEDPATISASSAARAGSWKTTLWYRHLSVCGQVPEPSLPEPSPTRPEDFTARSPSAGADRRGAEVFDGQARFLKSQLRLPVSTCRSDE